MSGYKATDPPPSSSHPPSLGELTYQGKVGGGVQLL